MYLETKVWEKYFWYLIFTIVYSVQPTTDLSIFLDTAFKTVPCYQYKELIYKFPNINNILATIPTKDKNYTIEFIINLYNWIQKSTNRTNFIDRVYTDKNYGYNSMYINYKEYLVYLDHVIIFVFQNIYTATLHLKFLRYLAKVFPLVEIRAELEGLVAQMESDLSPTYLFEQFKKCYISYYKFHFKRLYNNQLTKNICKLQFKI